MLSFRGDVLQNLDSFDAVCILTNGVVKNNGAAVMGAGIAKQFRFMFNGIEFVVGSCIKKNGNRVQPIGKFTTSSGNQLIFLSFPTKHVWWEKSDIELIQESCVQLMRAIDYYNLKKVALPKPGCGNGRLDWDEVSSAIEPLLDDKVYICTF